MAESKWTRHEVQFRGVPNGMYLCTYVRGRLLLSPTQAGLLTNSVVLKTIISETKMGHNIHFFIIFYI